MAVRSCVLNRMPYWTIFCKGCDKKADLGFGSMSSDPLRELVFASLRGSKNCKTWGDRGETGCLAATGRV